MFLASPHSRTRDPLARSFRLRECVPGRKNVYRVLGVDLGQSGDYSAAALLEKNRYEGDFHGPPDTRIRCRQLKRWPLGTDYTRVVDDLVKIEGINAMIVDFTGVGRPVVDVLRKRAGEVGYKGKIIPVAIVASNAQIRQKQETRGTYYSVPKCDLISALVILQQQSLLRLPNVPETKILLEEMRNFKMTYTKAANVQFGARSGKNDDLVLCMCLCAWWMVRFGNRRLEMWCG